MDLYNAQHSAASNLYLSTAMCVLHSYLSLTDTAPTKAQQEEAAALLYTAACIYLARVENSSTTGSHKSSDAPESYSHIHLQYCAANVTLFFMGILTQAVSPAPHHTVVASSTSVGTAADECDDIDDDYSESAAADVSFLKTTAVDAHIRACGQQARTLLLDVAKLHTALQDGPGVVYALEVAVRASEAVHGTHANIVAKLCRRLGEARECCKQSRAYTSVLRAAAQCATCTVQLQYEADCSVLKRVRVIAENARSVTVMPSDSAMCHHAVLGILDAAADAYSRAAAASAACYGRADARASTMRAACKRCRRAAAEKRTAAAPAATAASSRASSAASGVSRAARTAQQQQQPPLSSRMTSSRGSAVSYTTIANSDNMNSSRSNSSSGMLSSRASTPAAATAVAAAEVQAVAPAVAAVRKWSASSRGATSERSSSSASIGAADDADAPWLL
eukprot:12251-Heterococcus_DN1.PRE.2